MDSDWVAESLPLILKAAATDRYTLVLQGFSVRFGLDLAGATRERGQSFTLAFPSPTQPAPAAFCWFHRLL